ncbi:MAG: hypothetical protein GY855_14800 [candidate division Zixibacteria bacterium]|nr:hypothetical protein [candidate division Zixibacteria bacterium]
MGKLIHIVLFCLLFVSCQMKIEPTIDAGIDECQHCTMIIQNVDQGSVTITDEEELSTFCSPVCLILDKNMRKAQTKSSDIYEYLFDHIDNTPIPAQKAYIVHGDFNSAMGHGLLAFSKEFHAERFAAGVSGEILSWNDLRRQHETPDKYLEINISKEDNPVVFEVLKDQVVSVTINNSTLQEIKVILTGYDFEVEIPANDKLIDKLIADKPGQGFVFQDSNSNVLASLIVKGDHTDEEAIYR